MSLFRRKEKEPTPWELRQAELRHEWDAACDRGEGLRWLESHLNEAAIPLNSVILALADLEGRVARLEQ